MESWVSSICDTEIPLQLRKIDYLATSFSKSLQSLKSTAHQTAQFKVLGFLLHALLWATNQKWQLEEAKGKVREAEDDLVKAITVKTRQEAKRMALSDAIASAKARVEGFNASI
ncbi:hypothetical protein HN51_012079 [Arachis hypogaea]